VSNLIDVQFIVTFVYGQYKSQVGFTM